MRLNEIDLLRVLAILMVILRHVIIIDPHPPTILAPLVNAGWAGVDLFFVLSGFLISGLLFSEFQSTGGIRFRRFFVRRAIRILPPYCILLLITVTCRLIQQPTEHVETLGRLRNDVLFIQSYREGTWGHFWSLSVEEHFYILLPLCLSVLLQKYGHFKQLPTLFLVVAPLILAARIATWYWISPFNWYTHLFPTHLRIDSLLFGVILGYYYRLHRKRAWEPLRKRAVVILATSLAVLSPLLFLEQSNAVMYTVWFSFLYLGFGGLIFCTLHWEVGRTGILAAVSKLGAHSYSIYLWNVPAVAIVKALGGTVPEYIALNLVLGVGMSYAVEKPSLWVRERLFAGAAPENTIVRNVSQQLVVSPK